jgi:hypothetical protein
VVIAVVVHVIVFAVLGVMYVKTERAKELERPTAIDFAKDKKEEEKPPEPVKDEIVDRTAMPKADTTKESEIVDPDRDVGLEAPVVEGPVDLSKEAGDPNANDTTSMPAGGTSLGVGVGGGIRGSGRPGVFAARSQHDVDKNAGSGMQGRGGPTQKSEAAVRAGQLWLIRHQQPDGSWAADKMKDVCDKNGGCCPSTGGPEFTAQYNEGLTGLALLAFFGSGQTDESKNFVVDTLRKSKHYFGESVIKPGLKWLRARQEAHKDGRFSDDGHIYNESLATLAMCEAYALTRRKVWGDCAQRGIDFLVASQRLNPSGNGLWGWRYEPRAWLEGPEGKAAFPDPKEYASKLHEADISATTWVVMALKSAELADLKVPEESMRGAMDFVKNVTVKDGRVAYMDPLQIGRKITGEGDEYMFHPTTLGALGMCCRTFIEKNLDDPILELSASQIIKDLPAIKDPDPKSPKDNKLGVDYYYWYYASLALNQLDGPGSPKRSNKYWNKWNTALTETLLPLQDDSATCARGGWPTPDRWSHSGGPIYRTAINVLTLEVYYRYENAFGASVVLKKPKDDKSKDEKGREEKGREDEKKPK